ncbi:5-carboxymethyl-2-hydroxymuconate delta isomerase [Luminiphilus syltensis NOR5-1B]|uniref:5-carboxymethyl-2-hydroxymuconate delta isomerase n=1 Tax=Luminiphilus syltensis NOR5-1B TaxID=565045 RepID=B8KTQ4_9GAMM|nr:5-carboxymethyl-2-hydroxymuconate Delta-isomerase [Luminiphilus syltensis]EED35676.1 5-carboxymethyl-2-hydroxymuconate delta isomerase [Luminiphilus syltensis NOR5-1B]
MPHLIVDYSANLPEPELQLDSLLDNLVHTAIGTGLFPESGMRARAIRCDHYRVGNGDPDNGFINVSMRVGAGRDLADLQSAGEQIFETLKQHTAALMQRQKVALSCEMRELAPVKFNFKNL